MVEYVDNSVGDGADDPFGEDYVGEDSYCWYEAPSQESSDGYNESPKGTATAAVLRCKEGEEQDDSEGGTEGKSKKEHCQNSGHKHSKATSENSQEDYRAFIYPNIIFRGDIGIDKTLVDIL